MIVIIIVDKYKSKAYIIIPDPCDPNPCANSGICSSDGTGGYSCDCSETLFTGVNCTIAPAGKLIVCTRELLIHGCISSRILL